MELLLSYLTISSLVIWSIIVLLPWRPWWTTERFKVDKNIHSQQDLSDVTVLIPARNEALVIKQTLQSVIDQGGGINIILIDDNSTDETADKARELNYTHLSVLQGKKLAPGWSGKMWGLEQGRNQVQTSYTLLLDADIKIAEELVSQLKEKLLQEHLDFVSLMAKPPLESFAEQLLMPAFIYFFKLLYPFRLSNSSNRIVAAAAGGCILVRTEAMERIGGFAALKGALIDDCTLARKIKDKGYKIWLGLTHDVQTVRPYTGWKEIWDMVARTAFNQLQYSFGLLLLCSILMIITFVMPLIAVSNSNEFLLGLVILGLIYLTYLPTVLYYRVPWWTLVLLPFVGILYLLMTWTSAFRYWKGEQVRWRGRIVIRDGGEQVA